uniref:BPI2 domain-containing protein n=1 Tax=Syphacia muris TaxID=451379 RepID=A0A0N5AXX6_9BILA
MKQFQPITLLSAVLLAANFATVATDDNLYPTDFVPIKSAIRLRLNQPIFSQLSRITDHLYNTQITQAVIPQQQQCFPEGCMRIYNFQITAHRSPTIVQVSPMPPNLVSISIRDFDIYITGSLTGQLQPLQPLPLAVPASGSLSASAVQLGIASVLDVQKNIDNIPYLRLVSCTMNEGNVGARVENMGLINEITEIIAKTREVMQATMCANVQEIIETEFNSRLAKMPTKITVKELTDLFLQNSENGEHDTKKRYNDITLTNNEFSNSDSVYRQTLHRNESAASHTPGETNLPISKDRLTHLTIYTDVLDTSATYEKFFVGVNGEVSVADDRTLSTLYSRPNSLKFLTPSNGRGVELLVSEYTLNTMLYKAHTIDAIVFRIGSESPSFGKLLRTSCSVDEVCLTDMISEPGERYPNTQLEIILRSTQPPTVQLTRSTATIRLEGRALFYIEGTSKKVGVIPFETTVVIRLVTNAGVVVGTFDIPSLVFKKDLDFFGLSRESLEGLRSATRSALIKLANSKLSSGITLNTQPNSRFTNPTFAVVNQAILVQADFNFENDFYRNSVTKQQVQYSGTAKR